MSIYRFLPMSSYLFLMTVPPSRFFFFFFNDTATTEIYTLSLHDALPIYEAGLHFIKMTEHYLQPYGGYRSEEHTSELQSRLHLVCRLLLEKKKKTKKRIIDSTATCASSQAAEMPPRNRARHTPEYVISCK